jgi:hypothetical protein
MKMKAAKYHEMAGNYEGICTTCKETQDQCEPDAHEYKCDSCLENTVYGVPELLLMGLLEIKE